MRRFGWSDASQAETQANAEVRAQEALQRLLAAGALIAACAFMESVGAGGVHPEIAPVLKLHDEMCRATIDLPIA